MAVSTGQEKTARTENPGGGEEQALIFPGTLRIESRQFAKSFLPAATIGPLPVGHLYERLGQLNHGANLSNRILDSRAIETAFHGTYYAQSSHLCQRKFIDLPLDGMAVA